MSTEPAGDGRAPLYILGGGLLIGLVAGLLVFVGLPALPSLGVRSTPGGPTATPAPAAIVGAPAPDFALTNLAGETVKLSDLQGQVVIVNFWATWCGPCKAEMPLLQAAAEARQGQGLTVLAVDADDPAGDVQAYVTDLGLTFPVLLDPGTSVTDLYQVRGWPTSYFINRDGYVADMRVGPLTDGLLNDKLNTLGLGE
jgi:peroxiredoxin